MRGEYDCRYAKNHDRAECVTTAATTASFGEQAATPTAQYKLDGWWRNTAATSTTARRYLDDHRKSTSTATDAAERQARACGRHWH